MSWSRSIRTAAPTSVAYLLVAALTLILTRLGGGVAFIWVSNALLIARLLTAPRNLWRVHLAMCAVASAVATSLFGFGTAAAIPMAAVNMFEAFLAAWLLRRITAADLPMESLRGFGAFVLATGLAAPAASAIGAAAVADISDGGGFNGNLARWFFGHSLGTITFMPIFMFAYEADLRTRWAARSTLHTVEACLLLLLVGVTSLAVFAQGDARLLFLPMLPITLASFRGGWAVAAASVVLLTLVGTAFTLNEEGPIAVVGGELGDHLQFLQFYLAATVLSVLPVAAELTRRATLFQRLRDSEARYRLLADNSTDIIMNVDVGGRIRFVSPSITRLGGYAPELLLGSKAADLVRASHRTRVQRAHVAALRGGGETTRVEYQARTQDGVLRWFETRSRSVQDAQGSVDGTGHRGPEGLRAPALERGAHGLPDGAAQPPGLRRKPQGGDRRRRGGGAGRLRGALRHRPLQAGERHLRPHRW
jgi:PAS domain S-box-containing protein